MCNLHWFIWQVVVMYIDSSFLCVLDYDFFYFYEIGEQLSIFLLLKYYAFMKVIPIHVEYFFISNVKFLDRFNSDI